MASPYVALLRTPRAWPFSLAGFFARLPLSMGGLALLLMMVDITDSYFIAGAVDATWILVGAVAAPAIAMLIDRYGQRRVIGPQICLYGLGVCTLLVLAAAEAPLWSFFLAAAVSGASLPVVGAVVRARWTYVLSDPMLMRTAYSWESVVDEFVFVVGPPLAASVAAAFSGAAALGLTAIIGSLGTVALLAQRQTEPPPKPPDTGRGQLALKYRGMPSVALVMFMLGVLFAGVEVTVIATAREGDNTAAAGVVLALWSIASLAAGLIVGGMKKLPGLHVQLIVGAAATWLLLTPLLFVHSLVGIGAVLLFAGAGVSPALIAGFALASRLVPSSALTQALTWASIAIGTGFAIGSPASGWLVDEIAIEAGFWVALTAGFIATACAVVSRDALAHEYDEPRESPNDDLAV
ncbi:MAG TPA: MFS transporter [Actinomycetes bacterium]|nr:MFS transporter [Actinomycetes bacterium]